MRTSAMNLSQLMMSLGGRTQSKIGLTTTVKQQVDQIQINIQHFKKSLQSQRKQQNQLQFQLKKFEQTTKTDFQQLNKQVSQRVNYLTDLFKSDSRNQNKQFQYLQLQNKTLHDQHDKLNQLTNNLMSRAQQTQNNVGI